MVAFIIVLPTVVCGLESVMLKRFYAILAVQRGPLRGQKQPPQNIHYPEGFLDWLELV